VTSTGSVLMHGSCVAVGDNAVLFLGKSGTGKSGLALQMIALGAVLVADDGVKLTRVGDAVAASAPENLVGMIEARGLGILTAPHRQNVPLAIIVDLEAPAEGRLPTTQKRNVLGLDFALFSGKEVPNLAAALMVKLGVKQ
jgi:HPr kinase/phosphorylase